MSSTTIRLQHSIYPAEAISRGAHEFRDFCTVSHVREDDGSVLTVEPNEGAPDETVDELLNYILCAALELHLTG